MVRHIVHGHEGHHQSRRWSVQTWPSGKPEPLNRAKMDARSTGACPSGIRAHRYTSPCPLSGALGPACAGRRRIVTLRPTPKASFSGSKISQSRQIVLLSNDLAFEVFVARKVLFGLIFARGVQLKCIGSIRFALEKVGSGSILNSIILFVFVSPKSARVCRDSSMSHGRQIGVLHGSSVAGVATAVVDEGEELSPRLPRRTTPRYPAARQSPRRAPPDAH